MFSRLKAGIARTRDSLVNGVQRLFTGRTRLDAAALETLETLLLSADVGVNATARIVEKVRRIPANQPPAEAVQEEMTAILSPCEQPFEYKARDDGPFIILVVGVNGAGKTTTIAKIARRLKGEGRSVMLAAGDTFRAAAVDQLKRWGERLDIPVIAQGTGADTASVIFDACAAAKARKVDVLIADTAGRLHTQDNLMAELAKVRRVVSKHQADAPHETLLVLDATMGQNALNQAQEFMSQVAVTALCLTKLDGTAKGGVIFALAERLRLPIRYVGIGEKADDLQVFNAREFTRALLGDFAGSKVDDDES
jgi:fused signal recognition particle receptor